MEKNSERGRVTKGGISREYVLIGTFTHIIYRYIK